MRFILKLTVVLAVLGGLGYLGTIKTQQWLKERRRPSFRTAKVERGNIRVTRNATGEVKPVLSVQVGSFVSGPIEELYVEFNDRVTKGQVLATIDPRLYEAYVARDKAALENRKAEVFRVQAELQRAKNDKKRALALQEENKDFISQAEMDQITFSCDALIAQLRIAEASVDQAEANLVTSQTNLNYTNITAPVDGFIIDRKIDPGQTLAAQFQTPELFVIAPDMQKKMHIFASIDEADIGLIRKAKDNGSPVMFSVEAYPDELFEHGEIEQIRLSSNVTQSVVTYPVVVATPNEDLRLLPGMTASLTFLVEEKKDILKVPNAAIRYLPQNKEHVRKEDQARLDFSTASTDENQGKEDSLDAQPVDERAESKKKSETRHVWIQEGEKLKAIEVRIGVTDYQFTELVSGDLKEGDKLITGLKPKS